MSFTYRPSRARPSSEDEDGQDDDRRITKTKEAGNQQSKGAVGDESDGYVPYVPVKKRKEAELHKLLDKKLSRKADKPGATRNQHSTSTSHPTNRKTRDDEDDEDDDDEKLPSRSTTTLLQEAQVVKRKQAELDAFKTEAQKKSEEENKVIDAIAAQKKKLGGAQELAKGVEYTESMTTSWIPPSYIRKRTPQDNFKLRERLGILVEGDDCPPPIEHFQDMRLPHQYSNTSRRKKSNFQHQSTSRLPVALSGRDMIGIAFTGGRNEAPIYQGEGPVGIIVCPSRELARQTYEGLLAMALACAQSGKYPQLGTLLCIGGISMADQSHVMSKGFHMVVATPGRLQDMLEKRKFSLDNCTYLCLDEADRMVDMGFEDDVRNIMSFLKHFAENSLVRPIVVNVGRAGAANLDVIQEVEYVKQEAKMVYLLECLQKTPPPVIIFSDNKNEVDDIQEYLLLKGVEAVAIHGSKEEREYAIKSFKSGKKDVMVASGVASKGLDFAEIQHVINFTMPGEIENYVHQIGRTGRSGKTGIATTFINMNSPEPTLLDLKYLLLEAKQRIPQFLQTIEDPNAGVNGGANGCQFCGGQSFPDWGTLRSIVRSERTLNGENEQAIIGKDGAGGGTREGDTRPSDGHHHLDAALAPLYTSVPTRLGLVNSLRTFEPDHVLLLLITIIN
ncbi:hypothetical protein PSHT_07730 [Puccinia striiformis]|uniref:RNA helicase n=1 Tax=Puccinia striiformis TaxID=27350 RepID=A0A2S4VVL8_9BASI|nr:hypothetical protein PSHT_07730 [Puccinia striiformis]